MAIPFDVQELLQNALLQIDRLGIWAPVAFILTYIVATVCLLPGSLLTLGAGVIFGPVWGALYVWVGATLGATAAFGIGRYLVRSWVAQQIAGNAKFKAVEAAVAKEGKIIVLLTRLSPIFPFNLLNYAFGITAVSLPDYLVGCIGMIPGTVLCVYIGSVVGSLANLVGATHRARSPVEWAVYGLGLVAAIAVTVYITKIARQALEQKVS